MVSIKSIWESHVPTDEIIIKTQIEDVKPFKCFAATNHITGNHLFIFETSLNAKYPEFKNFKFKGLFIEVYDFTETKELHIYLLDNQLKDIFSLFIENIIEDISKCVTENEALVETSNVVLKWKKLFDKINFQGLTIERQKGLIGELLLFNSLLDEEYSIDKLLESWTGPDYEDKDFLFGSFGVEVKLTSSKVPKIKISSERQLDSENLTKLYLVLYVVEEIKDKGFSLNSIVEQIRAKINYNQNALKFFNERLLLVGYFDEDFENYNRQYAFRKRNFYEVTSAFPKLVASHLPIGLFDTKYNIELSAVEQFIINNESILELIK
ncbi:PD-(D/E)XK motif protein [Flavobacterium sp. N1994]|uniref:PD-(D/E)XK motif protein n=1 Tax=Flavobacterium sp. N1994 TaxID=2986827 RepID=UPI00222182F1|nr:PD-(D/E)XK motif protein [Flavobacterium sp. N1994]